VSYRYKTRDPVVSC